MMRTTRALAGVLAARMTARLASRAQQKGVAAVQYLSRRHMLRAGAAIVAAGTSGILVAACGAGGSSGGSEAPQPATGQPVKVTFFSPASDPQGDEIMRDQTKQFNDKNKNIQIDYVFTATDDNYKNYTTAMISGSSPDVIMTYDYPPVPQWQAKGLIRDLEQYRKEVGIKQDDYFANVWQMITFGGKLYGFLQEFDANLLIIDNETVSRAGLDPNNPPRPSTISTTGTRASSRNLAIRRKQSVSPPGVTAATTSGPASTAAAGSTRRPRSSQSTAKRTSRPWPG